MERQPPLLRQLWGLLQLLLLLWASACPPGGYLALNCCCLWAALQGPVALLLLLPELSLGYALLQVIVGVCVRKCTSPARQTHFA
jgi:hypothetical protein